MFVKKIMYNSEVEIDIFPLVFEKKKFDFKKFYVDLLKIDIEDINAGILEPSEKIEELNIKLKKKEFKKRVVFKTNLKFTEKNKVAIKMFSLYKKLKKPTSIPLDAKTNTRIKSITKNKCVDTDEVLQNEKIGRYIEKGNEKIPFLEMELKQIKNLTCEEFLILGFKPKNSLKNYLNLGPSLFITPDDDIIQNSSKVFDALISEMSKKEKIAIARIKKNNSSLKFFALMPQKEEIINDNLKPAGFNAILLPFADDIRDLKKLFKNEKNLDPDKQDLEIAIELIDNLTIDNFEIKNFENPDIQKFYSFLQALALNEETPDKIEDFLLPDFEGLLNKVEVIERFNDHFQVPIEIDEDDCFDELNNLEKIGKKQIKNESKKNGKKNNNSEKKNKKTKKKKDVERNFKKNGKKNNEEKIFEEDEKKDNIMEEEKNHEEIFEEINRSKSLTKIKKKIMSGNLKSVVVKELDIFLKKFGILEKSLKIEKFKKALQICNKINN